MMSLTLKDYFSRLLVLLGLVCFVSVPVIAQPSFFIGSNGALSTVCPLLMIMESAALTHVAHVRAWSRARPTTSHGAVRMCLISTSTWREWKLRSRTTS